MKRPVSITIIAVTFIVLGLLAAFDVFVSLMESRFRLNLCIFMFVVGIGLMKLKESSRKWAIFWCMVMAGLSVIGLVVALFGTAYFSVEGTVLGGAHGRIVAAAALLLVAAVFVRMNIVLARSDTRILFGSE